MEDLRELTLTDLEDLEEAKTNRIHELEAKLIFNNEQAFEVVNEINMLDEDIGDIYIERESR